MVKKKESYVPSRKILDKYASVLVNFALGGYDGVKQGDVVLLRVPECAKPFLVSLRRAVLKAGAHPLIEYVPDDMGREFYETAGDSQLCFFPKKYFKGKVDEIDHLLVVIAESDKHEFEGVDAKKIMMRERAFKPYMDWRNEKENRGKFTWTIALYGTPAMAEEAGLSLKEYWGEIIRACYVDSKNPVKEWRKIVKEIERVRKKLNDLKIEKVRVVAEDTDLIVGIGKNRQWLGGSGRNIPSFEIFISPDWRMTEGHVKFTEPLYRYGHLIKNVMLKFEKGKVVSAEAERGEKLLREMIAVKNANKIGEFSLTDSRLSRIRKFMGETLFDENVGGKFGNTHLALGNAYQDSYPGNPSKVSKKRWKDMGFNDSVIHTDIVATSDRKVTAYLRGGKEKVIYDGGKFLV